MMSFYGSEALLQHKDLVRQYERCLDSYALGVLALELICSPALAGHQAKEGERDELRGSWRRLLTAWSRYRKDVTRWHSEIYKVFSVGGDVTPVYLGFAKEGVVDKVLHLVATVRACLRACIHRTNDAMIQNLLWAVAELLDEGSSVSLSVITELVSRSGETASLGQAASSQGARESTPSRPAASAHAARPVPVLTLCRSAPSLEVPGALSGRSRGEAPWGSLAQHTCTSWTLPHALNFSPAVPSPLEASPPVAALPRQRSFTPRLVRQPLLSQSPRVASLPPASSPTMSSPGVGQAPCISRSPLSGDRTKIAAHDEAMRTWLRCTQLQFGGA